MSADQTATNPITELSAISDPVVVRVLWAAMCSMTHDIHQPQDNLTSDEWDVADAVFKKLDAMVNEQ